MKSVFTVLALLAGAGALQAQATRPEIRPFVGASLPTGNQRDRFGDEAMYGVQAAMELKPTFHLVGTFGWVPGHTSYVAARNKVDVFQYNVGAELGMVRQLSGAWELRPFVGLGIGGRTYAYQAASLSSRTCFAGYGALGTELQLNRTAIRFEARDNLFCYKEPLAGASSRTRNDVGLSLGIAYHLR